MRNENQQVWKGLLLVSFLLQLVYGIMLLLKGDLIIEGILRLITGVTLLITYQSFAKGLLDFSRFTASKKEDKSFSKHTAFFFMGFIFIMVGLTLGDGARGITYWLVGYGMFLYALLSK